MSEANPELLSPSPHLGWRRAFSQLRVKLTWPYVLMAVLLALAATYISTSHLVRVSQDRFIKSLQDAARRAADTMVEVERRQLVTVRAVANTQGVPEAVEAQDQAAVLRLASLIALNDGVNCLEIIAADKTPLLSMHRARGGGPLDYDFDQTADYAAWPLVNRILDGAIDDTGDKFAELIETPWGWTFYTGGPIKQDERIVGVVLVGTYIDTLAAALDPSALANITLYSPKGAALASTLTADLAILHITPDLIQQSMQADSSQRVNTRQVDIAGHTYAEVFATWVVRRSGVLEGGDTLGLLSVSLETAKILSDLDETRNLLILLFSAATAVLLAIGAGLATQIVRPIQSLVTASQRVAGGDLAASVTVKSSDEVGDLSQAFNTMTTGLRERQRERDLFGRTVSPEVRDALLADKLGLGGETLCASVLFSDIVGFTSMSENLPPQGVVAFLNEYFIAMEKPIRANGGIINKYVGDAIVAIFGAPVEHPNDATRAVQAALEMRAQLAALNQARQARGEPPLAHGIGISTGQVVAGVIGSPQRLEYTVIGDTVNVASRLQELTRGMPGCDILVTEGVIKALENTEGMTFEDIGRIQVKGRTESVHIFELKK